MKKAKWMLLGALIALANLAVAQVRPIVVAQVPFEFAVSNRVIPAGEYQIISVGRGQALLIRNIHAKASMPSMYFLRDSNRGDKTALVFHRYGERYFLSAIRVEGNNWTYQLPESKAEVELRTQYPTASKTTVLAAVK
jgi:hypothetical protein